MDLWLADGISNDDRMEFQFEVPRDGRFEFHLWLWSADMPTRAEATVDSNAIAGIDLVQEAPGYFRCGRVCLTRGRHLLSLRADRRVERVFLSERPDRVRNGAAQLLWDNRVNMALGEARDVQLSESQRHVLIRHGFLFDREDDTKHCRAPGGVPLGGIGAGKIELTSEGLITAVTINNNQDCPIYRLPGSFFAVSVENGRSSVTRLLQTRPVDQPFTPVRAIEAELVFPEASLRFRDPALNMEISLHAFSPHVPDDEMNSALPVVFFRFTLKNSSATDQNVRLMFSWENTINVGGHMRRTNQSESRILPLVKHTWNHAFAWSDRRSNYAEVIRRDGGTGLCFTARNDRGNPSSFGRHVIWTPGDAAAAADRVLDADDERFAAWFASGMTERFLPGAEGEFRAGAMIVGKTIMAGGTDHVDFVLAWYMPVYMDPQGNNDPPYYSGRFAGVGDVLSYAWGHRNDLLNQTRRVRVLLEESTLPAWFARQLLDSRFVAHTNTMFNREGWFSVNESPTGMFGCLGTLDQRTCSGAYWTTFFPRLDAIELELFRRCQTPEGIPSHEVGFGGFELANHRSCWPDLAAAYVIQVHRHYCQTGDRTFLEQHWPEVRKAIEWATDLDETGCGVPTLKPGRGTTYDNQHWDGISAFVSTMHEACLTRGADLAERMGDASRAQRWREGAEKCHRTRIETLWVRQGDAGYLRNAYNPSTGQADDSCFISALAGEWAILEAGLPIRFSRAVIRTALEGIWERNIRETGMTDQSGRPGIPAFMQYPVAYFGAAALRCGCADLAWGFLERQDQIITRPPSTHFNQVLTYTPEGHPVGLPYYMTAPVSWVFLDAVSGIVPDVERGRWILAPRPSAGQCELRVPVFTATSWCLLTYEDHQKQRRLSLHPRRQVRPVTIRELVLAGEGWEDVSRVRVNGRVIAWRHGEAGLHVPVECDPGHDSVEVLVEYR